MTSDALSLEWPLHDGCESFAGGVDLYTRGGAVDLLRLDPAKPSPARACAPLIQPVLAPSPWLNLSNAEFGDSPFPYLNAPDAIDADLAETLASLFQSGIRWVENDGGFYAALECDLRAVGVHSPAAALFAPAALTGLETQASAIFNAPLRLVGAIAGHRLDAGRGIGIHTDRPSEDEETHRILFTVGATRGPAAGGHFIFADGPRGENVRRIVPLRHNTAIAFALTESSYHGVTVVREGPRFSVVFSFTSAAAPPPA